MNKSIWDKIAIFLGLKRDWRIVAQRSFVQEQWRSLYGSEIRGTRIKVDVIYIIEKCSITGAERARKIYNGGYMENRDIDVIEASAMINKK